MALTSVFVVYGVFTSLADDILRSVFINRSCKNYHTSSTEFQNNELLRICYIIANYQISIEN